MYIGLLIIFLAGLTALALFIYLKPNSTSGRQAVFLINGQVYFGQIDKINHDFLVLKNIYYLSDNSKLNSNEQNAKVSIIKLGQEVHGPEDIMYINRAEILFYENMKSDSEINKAIDKYLKEKK